jgi:hypothetical protein
MKLKASPNVSPSLWRRCAKAKVAPSRINTWALTPLPFAGERRKILFVRGGLPDTDLDFDGTRGTLK